MAVRDGIESPPFQISRTHCLIGPPFYLFRGPTNMANAYQCAKNAHCDDVAHMIFPFIAAHQPGAAIFVCVLAASTVCSHTHTALNLLMPPIIALREKDMASLYWQKHTLCYNITERRRRIMRGWFHQRTRYVVFAPRVFLFYCAECGPQIICSAK